MALCIVHRFRIGLERPGIIQVWVAFRHGVGTDTPKGKLADFPY